MRLNTPTVNVRGVKIGGKNSIVIQSMTNTDTADAQATANQCIELADADAEIVRITVNTNLAAPAVPKIRQILDEKGYRHLPLIGDFHYNGHDLLTRFPDCAKALDKYRINPGNVGHGNKHYENFATIVKIAIANDKPIRIGVNWGSLDQDLLTEMMNKNAQRKSPKSDREVIIDAMVKSALKSAELAEKLGLAQNKIILSVKMSAVQDTVKAYELLAKKMQKNHHLYALHLGLTEAGSGLNGIISSTSALSILLNQGIGDTIRISLTPTPKTSRTEEVEVAKILLQSLGYRHFKPQVTSCPGCGRTDSVFFQELAAQVNKTLEEKLKHWRKSRPRVVEMKVAVMGCAVNGPGESKHADIAISLPGKMEKPVAPIYIKGKFIKSLSGNNIPQQFMEILEKFVEENY